jgi:GNAT superfamily N-acetyltransferase
MTFLSSNSRAADESRPAGDGVSAQQEVSFEPINFGHLLPAFSIAKDSFPASDMPQLIREYRAVVYENGSFHEPSLSQRIEVVSNIMAYLDRVPAGIAGVYRCGEEKERLWLSWFAVRDDLRGNGIGQQILERCERIARNHGAKVFAAYTEDDLSNAHCHRFYERCGYLQNGILEVDGHTMRVYEKHFDAQQCRPQLTW